MTSLNELVLHSNTIINKILENNGEIPDDVALELEVNESLLANKIDSYAVFTDKLKSDAEYFKSKASEFSNMAKSLSNLEKNLKERIKFVMSESERDEIVGNTYRYKLSKTNPSLDVSMDALEDDYKKTTVLVEPDKDKIKSDLKAGKVVVGASLVENKSLRRYLKK